MLYTFNSDKYFKGRVLKDDDQLSDYKIQSNHTIHMVKGVARTQPEAASPQRLPAMQAGQSPSDPGTLLNSHLAYGALAGFNPFADLGVNTNDPNMVCLRKAISNTKTLTIIGWDP